MSPEPASKSKLKVPSTVPPFKRISPFPKLVSITISPARLSSAISEKLTPPRLFVVIFPSKVVSPELLAVKEARG